jgi:hypothetical protein
MFDTFEDAAEIRPRAIAQRLLDDGDQTGPMSIA